MQKLRKASIPTIAASFIAFFIVLLVTRANPAFFPLALIPILFAAILLGIKGGTASSLVAMALVSLVITKEHGLPWPPGYGLNMLVGFFTYALTGFLAGLWSTTERRRAYAEEEIKQRNRALSLLNRVVAAASTTLEPKAVLEITCRELALAFDVPQTAAALLNEAHTAAIVVAEYLAEGRPSAMGVVIPVEGNPATQYVLKHKAPLAIADAQHDPRMAVIHDVERQRGTVSLLILPLMVRGEVMGTLGLDTIERREFSDEEITLAASAAAAAAQAMENARLFEAEHHARQISDTLSEIARELNVAPNLNAALDLVLSCMERVIAYDSASILLLENGQMSVAAVRGFEEPERVLNTHLDLDTALLNKEVVETRRPLIIGSVADDPRWGKSMQASGLTPDLANIHSWIGVPLLVQDWVIGMLTADKAEPDFYQPEDAGLALAFANHAAIAIENARLYEEKTRTSHYLQSVLDSSIDLIFTIKPDGTFGYFNPRLTEITGYQAEAIRGRPFLDFIPEDRRLFMLQKWQEITHGIGGTYETEIVAASGQRIPVLVSHSVIEGFNEYLAILRDISDIKAAERKILQRAEESETLRKAGSLVAATLDPEEAISRILEQLEHVVPHDSASVQLLRDGELEIVGGRGWPEPASVIGIRFPVPGDNPNTVVIQTRQPYVLDETDKVYPIFRQPPHSHIRSWLGVPLIVRNEVTGLLAIDSAEPHHFTIEHVQMAAAFADQVAIALENARLFGSAQRQAKRQAALLQLSADLAGNLDEKDICRRAAHNLHDTLGFDQVSVYLMDEDSGDRVLQLGIGLPDQLIPERMPPGRGLSERPLLDGQLHYTPDVTQESNYIPGNNGSEVDAPIRIGEEVRGVLIIESARVNAFSQNDCDVINTAANLIGLALTRAGLFASERRQFEELAVLHAIAMAMTEAKNVDELLERTTRLIGEKLFPDNFGILLLDETANVLRLHSTYRLGIQNKEQFTIPIGQGITGVVVESGQPRRVADVSKDAHYISVDANIRSEICVPLKIGGQVIGVINAESVKLNAFTLADERLLTTLASQLAIGIERLRAVDKIYQLYEEQQHRLRDLALLHEISKNVSASLNLGEVINRVVQGAVEAVGADAASLNLLLEAGQARLMASVGLSEQFKARTDVRPGGTTMTVIRTRQPLLIPDVTQRPDLVKPIVLEEGIKSYIVLPLPGRERVMGAMFVFWRQEHLFSDDEVRLLTTFTNQVALGIENARLFAEVQNLALTDPLTGLYNRRGLFELGRLEFARARRFGRPFASMMLDIDHFKRVNDNHGHPIGDVVLKALAIRFLGSVREIDLVGRYGGEEFVFLLPETTLDKTREIAERLRKTIAQTPIPTEAGELNVTISAGLAMYDENTADLETLIARADQAMYVAKHKGRNRIAISR
ncbi:MAG: GAF domain-containing protein [Anaerolineales bacterium]|nr:GAF domain-containing protein [Anaerolineales bacterium]